MTMRLLSTRAGLFQLLLLIFFANPTNAETRTTTTTRFSTTAITTETVTITTHGQVLAKLTTATSIERLPQPTATMSSGNGDYSPSILREQSLNSTNFFRNQYEATPLIWDERLAQYGKAHAEKCIWEHSGGPHGENMAEGFGTPTLAIDAWAGEETKYNWAAADFSESTGHFTQLVWQNTTRFGCGAVHCPGGGGEAAFGWFMVCEYDPPGNVVGQFKYSVRKAGESSDGVLGIGGAARMGGCPRLLVALVAASSLAAMWL